MSTVHTNTAQPAGPHVTATPPSVLSLSIHDDERVAEAAAASARISQTHTAGMYMSVTSAACVILYYIGSN